MSGVQQLFTEKLRPKTLDEVILPGRIRNMFQDEKLHQNYLLEGSAGLGKTSLAKVLTKDYPTKYINVSDESSVETIRNKITKWFSEVSLLDGKEAIKAVILDEVDGASDQFFKALRGTIEKFAHNGRFVATCNYINKVPEAIQSRFTTVSFRFIDEAEEKEVKKEYYKRVNKIFVSLGIKASKEAIVTFVDKNFPDMRTIVNKIQAFHVQGIKELTLDNVKKLNYSMLEVFDLILENGKKDTYENYKMLVGKYGTKVDDVLVALGNEFPEYLNEKAPAKVSALPGIIITAAKHQSMRSQVIDPVTVMLSCVYSIQEIIHG